MIESGFWSTRLRPFLVRTCQRAGLRSHFERVENAVGVGDPDVDYCINGVAGKIELKYSGTTPKRDTTPVLGRGNGMRKSQVVWAVRRLHAGGCVYLAIGTPGVTWFIDLNGYKAPAMRELEMRTALELDALCQWKTGVNTPTQLITLLTRNGRAAVIVRST